MRKSLPLIVSSAAFVLIMAACGDSATPTPNASSATGNPVQSVADYLSARVKPDVDKMISLSCAAWEPNARIEAQSTEGRKAVLAEGTQCRVASAQGDTAYIACTGKITTSYNGETRDFDLAQRQFKMVKEGGEWRMCGYKA